MSSEKNHPSEKKEPTFLEIRQMAQEAGQLMQQAQQARLKEHMAAINKYCEDNGVVILPDTRIVGDRIVSCGYVVAWKGEPK